MKPSELLQIADWCQHHSVMYDPISEIVFFSVLGAIYRCYDDPRAGDVVEKLRMYLGLFCGIWNDQPGRSKAQVIAAFEAIGE